MTTVTFTNKNLSYVGTLMLGLLSRFGGVSKDWLISYVGFNADGTPIDAAAQGLVITNLGGVTAPLLQGYLDSDHNVVAVNADIATITADGIAVTNLTCGSANFNYNIYKDGAKLLNGAVADGTLSFSTDTPGRYRIEVLVGNQSGYKEIIAT